MAKLNSHQRQAVEYLDGPLLVLAGPGTGKTQLISEKVAYILKNTDTNPENILCLTFTESGTTNMRERLKSTIVQSAEKVHISTYHAFGTDILHQYKNYSDRYNRNLDTAIDEVTIFKIVKKLQFKLPGSDILHGDKVKDIISVISSAKSANLTADDLTTIAKINLEDSRILSQAISPLLKNLVPRAFEPSLKNAYQPIFTILKPYLNTKPILKTIDRSIKILANDLKTALVEAESTAKIKPLSAWKDQYFEKDEKNNYRLKDRIANKKLLSLARIMSDYQAYLNTHNLYDFNDMIEEAVHILKEDRGFRLTLSERYQFILLDEFQDTNPSQFEIIKQLTDYEKPIIMAVGDDDQAIYEFQGASATNLTEFQKHYTAQVIPLIDNYRSTNEILDFSHHIISQAPNRFADKALISHQPITSESKIERHEFLSSDAEYDWIGERITELVKSGVPQSEIAIISYKTKYFLPLLPYLKSHPEINIAYEKKDNLFEDSKIHELLSIARFIYDSAQEKISAISLMEILSYDFWQIPMLEVIKTLNQARQDKKSALEYLAQSKNHQLQAIGNFLINLITNSFHVPLDIFFDYLLGTLPLQDFHSPFLDYYTNSINYDALILYENLASLRGKLYQHFPNQKTQLSDLITMLDDYNVADLPLTTSSPYRDSEDAVQVLTAHKAKGLEFTYVFLISTDHVAWGKGKGNNNLLVLPKNLLQIRHTGTTDGEKLRILYVALTRAKQGLIITNSLKDFNGKSPDRLEYFNEYITENNTLISPFLPHQTVNCHYTKNSNPKSLDSLKNWLHPYLTPSPDLRAIYKERLASFRLSASALTTFIDIIYAGPTEFFKRYVLGAPEGPTSESLIFGNLIHQTFEKVTNQNLDDQSAIDYFLQELSHTAIEPTILEHLRDKGPADLAISLKTFAPILHSGQAEVNLSSEKLTIAGVPVTGKIDHLIIDTNQKTLELYDFKTSNYHKNSWASHATLYKYSLQLGFYKLLLNASPTYKKYKITRAHILFVSPDTDGLVHDKVYEFNVQEETTLKNLIKSVYSSIKSLSFLDHPNLFLPPDPTKTLKDLKNFTSFLIDNQAIK